MCTRYMILYNGVLKFMGSGGEREDVVCNYDLSRGAVLLKREDS